MKSFNPFYLILAVTIFFTSCKKAEITTGSPSAATPVIPNQRLLLSSAQANDKMFFEYNADKTIKSYSWNNGYSKAVFNYEPNKMTEEIFSANKKVAVAVY